MSNKLRALKAAFNAVQHELWKSSGKGSDDDPRVKVPFYAQLFQVFAGGNDLALKPI